MRFRFLCNRRLVRLKEAGACAPLSRDTSKLSHHSWHTCFIDVKMRTRPTDKSAKIKILFLFSQSKHMLWVLKRTVSMRGFF